MSTTSDAMITTFHSSGLMAGIAKWSCALRTPTTRPLIPSRTMIGAITRVSPTVRSSSDSSVNSGMITPATRMNSTVIVVRTVTIRPNSAAASCSASLRFLCSSSSEKTGTKAADSAWSANSERIRFGT